MSSSDMIDAAESSAQPSPVIPKFSFDGFFAQGCSAHKTTRNGHKHPNDKTGKATGHYLAVNELEEGLVIVDFDSNKEDESLIKAIHQRFDDNMSEHLNKCVAVTTGRNGLHVYLRADSSTEGLFANKSSQISIFTVNGCSVDMFGSGIRKQRAGVMLPCSTVYDSPDGLHRRYDVSHGTRYDSEITMAVSEFIHVMDYDSEYKSGISKRLSVKSPNTTRSETSDDRSRCVDKDIVNKIRKDIVASHKRITIHGNKSISAWIVMCCLNSIDETVAKHFTDTIINSTDVCVVTEHGRDGLSRETDRSIPFEALVKRIYEEIGASSRIISRMITTRFHDVACTDIPQETRESISKKRLDIHDENITYETVICDYTHGKLSDYAACLDALKQVLAFIPNGTEPTCIVKSRKDGVIRLIPSSVPSLQTNIRNAKRHGHPGPNLLDAVISEEMFGMLLAKGLRFRSDDPDYISAFGGLPYEIVGDALTNLPARSYENDMRMSKWFELVEDIICDGNEKQAEWLHAWIHRMITARAPEDRPCKGIILYSREFGTGKTTFCKVLRGIIGKQHSIELTGLEDIVGKYNSSIQDKLLVIANEVSVWDDKNHDRENTLKTMITDDVLRVGEKYRPTITTDNMISFIFATNYEDALPIREGDRRLNMFSVSNKYAPRDGAAHPWWASFFDEYNTNTETILREITRYYTVDYPRHHPRDETNKILSTIPQTEGRISAMSRRLNPINRIIIDNFDEFTTGCVDADRMTSLHADYEKTYGKRRFADFKKDIIAKCNLENNGTLARVSVVKEVIDDNGRKTMIQSRVRLYRLRDAVAAELKHMKDAISRLNAVDVDTE